MHAARFCLPNAYVVLLGWLQESSSPVLQPRSLNNKSATGSVSPTVSSSPQLTPGQLKKVRGLTCLFCFVADAVALVLRCLIACCSRIWFLVLISLISFSLATRSCHLADPARLKKAYSRSSSITCCRRKAWLRLVVSDSRFLIRHVINRFFLSFYRQTVSVERNGRGSRCRIRIELWEDTGPSSELECQSRGRERFGGRIGFLNVTFGQLRGDGEFLYWLSYLCPRSSEVPRRGYKYVSVLLSFIYGFIRGYDDDLPCFRFRFC